MHDKYCRERGEERRRDDKREKKRKNWTRKNSKRGEFDEDKKAREKNRKQPTV